MTFTCKTVLIAGNFSNAAAVSAQIKSVVKEEGGKEKQLMKHLSLPG